MRSQTYYKSPNFWILVCFILVLTGFGYKNHFTNPFHFDDAHTIVSNQYIRDIKNIPLFFKDATTVSTLPANQTYRPGITTLNAIDCWLGGKGEPIPFYYHRSIFISFLLLGVVLFFFAKKLFDLARPDGLNAYAAALVSGLFLVHTANAETINYIIARSDSFSTLMLLIAMVVFMYFPQWRKFQLYLLPAIVAILVKEPAVMIAPLLFLFIYFFEKDSSLSDFFAAKGVKKFGETLVIIFPLLLVIVFLLWLIKAMIPPSFTPGNTSQWHYILTQPFVIVHYVNNFFLPFNLSADTDWKLITNPFDDRVIIGVLFIFGLIALAWISADKKEWRPVAFGILWFLLALLPTSVVPLSEVLNDHRPFFAYIGLCVAVVWTLVLLYQKFETKWFSTSLAKYGLVLLFSGILIAHSLGVKQRTQVWSSGESLWHDVTIKSPGNGRGLMNYGNALMAKGDYAGAIKYFTKAKEQWPYYSYIYTNLGVVYGATNKATDAEANFKYSLQLNNTNPETFYYYGMFLRQQKRYEEAKIQAQKGLTLSREHVGLNAFLRDLNANPIYTASGNERIKLIEQKAKNEPTPENYLNLSLEYYNLQRYEDCIQASSKALQLKPDYDLAYNNICSAYNALEKWDEAIAAGEQGLKTKPQLSIAKKQFGRVESREDKQQKVNFNEVRIAKKQIQCV
jgi:tetratricopeptide (TPR) repeat protein